MFQILSQAKWFYHVHFQDEKLEAQCVVEFLPRTYNYYVTEPGLELNTV